ncbi:MFS transporter [Rhodococcus sp. D2-41]|uniref:MFS transporter n=1 Tax=Speluncibacter jeojiensis TaxID=2710754 RepID=UPI00241026C9|nr:MFS transporter [Rhodococcus sp. D2-41]MDG3010159.1 MFS transporter [Rhodococcus sp. D2-41]
MTQTLSTPTPARLPRPKIMRRAWLVTGLLVVFMLVNNADKTVIAFGGVQIQKDLGLSPQEFGVIQSGFFWLFAAGALIFGALSSRVSSRWLLGGLMLTWVATMVPLLGTVGFGALLTCRVILGFAEGPAFALANHAVHSWFPAEKRALAGGVVSAGASIGTLIAAPVITWIIVTWTWHAAFYALIALGLAWTVAWFVLGKGAPDETAQAAPVEALQTIDAPYRTILKTGTVIGIGLLLFCSYWSTALKVAWLPVYLTDGLHYSTITTGRLVMLPYGLAAVGAIAAGWASNRMLARGISRRIARGYLSTALVAAAGVCMAAFTALHGGALQIILISLAFSLNTAAYGVALSAVADVVQSRKRGMILSGLGAVASVAGMVAPLLLGFCVGDAAHGATGYGTGFVISGVLMVVGSAIALLLINPERDITLIRRRVEETA